MSSDTSRQRKSSSSTPRQYQENRSLFWDTVLDRSSPPSSSTYSSSSLSSQHQQDAEALIGPITVSLESEAPTLPSSPTLNRMANLPNAHMASMPHAIDRPHPCPLCPARFRQRSHLTAHYRVVHHNCKPFVCPHCSHRFGKKYDLKMHVTAVHLRYRAFSCDRCHKSFAKKSNLSRHQMHRHSSAGLKSP